MRNEENFANKICQILYLYEEEKILNTNLQNIKGF